MDSEPIVNDNFYKNQILYALKIWEQDKDKAQPIIENIVREIIFDVIFGEISMEEKDIIAMPNGILFFSRGQSQELSVNELMAIIKWLKTNRKGFIESVT